MSKAASRCQNRLTIVGRRVDIAEFEQQDKRWPNRLHVRFLEMFEGSATRQVWLFETNGPPLSHLKRLSARWPRLTFLLDYDQEPLRAKGLVKTRAGHQRSVEFRY